MSLLETVQDVGDDAVVVRVKGEVDSDTVHSLVAALDTALAIAAAQPARPLIIELDDVTYFGSAGLNAVLNCHERGEGRGVAVRLVASNAEVMRPIEVTMLDRVLGPFKTVRDALAADAG